MLNISKANASSTQTVKVLILSFFPLDPNNPTMIDQAVTDDNDSLASIQTRTISYDTQIADALTTSTRYHGYKDPNALPALQYAIIDKKEYDEKRAAGDVLLNKALIPLEKAIALQPDDLPTLNALKQIYTMLKMVDKLKATNTKIDQLKKK